MLVSVRKMVMNLQEVRREQKLPRKEKKAKAKFVAQPHSVAYHRSFMAQGNFVA